MVADVVGAAGLHGDEALANHERLHQAVGLGLLGVEEADVEVEAVLEQVLEVGQITRCWDA